MNPWIANCGKVPNTNIPRTGYYLKRYWKRNTLRKDKKHQPTQKSHKTTLLRHQSNRLPQEDHISHIGSELLDEHEELEEPLSGLLPQIQHTLSHLQPKRGKTGPEGVECFRPTFLLKLEKSFSYSALEDPRYFGPEGDKENEDHGTKKQEGLTVGLEQHGIPCFLENGVFVVDQNLINSNKLKEDELKKDQEKGLSEIDLNINKTNKSGIENDKYKDEKNTIEAKKDSSAIENKENPISPEQDDKRNWIDKRFYNEPLKMQE